MRINTYYKILLLVISTLLSFSCAGNKDGIKIVYLFDISGSFIVNRTICLETANDIFNNIIDKSKGLGFPQIHEMYLIDDSPLNPMISFEKIKVPRPSVFLTSKWDSTVKEVQNQFVINIEEIENLPASPETNIKGAILRASNALQNKSLYGKAIILFSDLEDATNINISSEQTNLEDLTIYVIWEYKAPTVINPTINPTKSQSDQDDIKDFLISAGADTNRIYFQHISSVQTQYCVNFIRDSFR